MYDSVNENSRSIEGVNEKLKIHEYLIDMKARIKSLEMMLLKMNKKGYTMKDFFNYLRIAGGIALAYVIYKAIMAMLKG